jgi:phage terminase small subunit
MSHPNLTRKQEAFCMAYVETGCATEAYRKAGYSTNITVENVWTQASVLLKNPKVAQRVFELQKEIKERGILSLEEHIANLQHLRNMAAQDGKWQAAIQAEIAMGRVSGHNNGPGIVVNNTTNVEITEVQADLTLATPEELAKMDDVKAITARLMDRARAG